MSDIEIGITFQLRINERLLGTIGRAECVISPDVWRDSAVDMAAVVAEQLVNDLKPAIERALRERIRSAPEETE